MELEWQISSSNLGSRAYIGKPAVKCVCPFCTTKTVFRLIETSEHSEQFNRVMVALKCDGCNSIVSLDATGEKMYPSLGENRLQNLPIEIDKAYSEALKCMSVNAPSAAVTMFRKTIHSIGFHYGLDSRSKKKGVFAVIEDLLKESHITKKIHDALVEIKNIGADGAHLNENEPDMKQAKRMQELIDIALLATVIIDSMTGYKPPATQPPSNNRIRYKED